MISTRTLALGAAFALLATACGLGLSPRAERAGTEPAASADVAASDPADAAGGAGAPRPLPGLDTSGLSQREQKAFWQAASRAFAPCPEHAVSLVVCLEESRSCAGCRPMAELLAKQIQRGSSASEAELAADVRFSANTLKKVEVRDSPSKGPKDAPVTIVVFSDFQCPACRAALPMIEEAVSMHAKDVRLVHKFYPLPKHTQAKPAAYAAIAAMRQGKYREMERVLFANQAALSERDIEGYATDLGLDLARFRADMKDPSVHAMVERDRADGEAIELTHTPFVLINGRLFDPAYFRWDVDLEPWIRSEAELARSNRKAPPVDSNERR
jgi:protein-disulfide isomerase